MISPLARQRQQAKKQVNAPATSGAIASSSLHVLLAELDNDKKVLKGLARLSDKVEYKRNELIPKYRPHVEEYLASGATFKNPLFAQMVIWLFDIEELDTAIKWCDIAIERGLETGFKRDFAHFCSDSVRDWSERMAAMGHSIEPYFSQVFKKVRNDWRLKEKPTAKWYKFAGLLLLRDEKGKPRATSVGCKETLLKAQALLIEADNLYPAIGVMTHIDKIGQRIRALETGNNL